MGRSNKGKRKRSTPTKASPEGKQLRLNVSDTTFEKLEMAEMTEKEVMKDVINVNTDDIANSTCLQEIKTIMYTILEAVKPIVEIKDSIQSLTTTVNLNTEKIQHLESRFDNSDVAHDILIERVDKIEDACKCNRLMSENCILKQNITQLNSRIMDIEIQSRKNNLLFHGVPERQNENIKETIYDILVTLLKITDAKSRIFFTKIYRLGRMITQNSSFPRSILVCFQNNQDAVEVYKNRRMVQQDVSNSPTEFHLYPQLMEKVNESAEKVLKCSAISLDFPEQIRTTRRQLSKVLALAKKVDIKATMKVDKLIFRGKEYTLNDCYKISELNIQSIATEETATGIYFFGRFCPLSNFYPCSINIDNFEFSCTEQFYQYKKAITFGNTSVARQILLAEDPVIMKKLADKMPPGNSGEDAWSVGISIAVMEKGLRHKFEQNISLQKYLKDTGVKDIFEMNKYDEFWGTAAALSKHNIQKFKGENQLGKSLMKVRAEL